MRGAGKEHLREIWTGLKKFINWHKEAAPPPEKQPPPEPLNELSVLIWIMVILGLIGVVMVLFTLLGIEI